MEYENPQPTEGINYTQEHPFKEFAQLLVGLAAIAVLSVYILSQAAGFLVRYIPFEYEAEMVAELEFFDNESNDKAVKTRARLQALADKLAENMDLDSAMEITVHYSQSDTVNAFATLGGHLMFFEGLIEELDSEQELAAVMAHEIAHIQHRHPIVALGKGVTLAALVGVIGGASGSAAGELLIGSSANLSLLQFSKSQELEADVTAAKALNKTYGNIQGAKELFTRFAEMEHDHLDSAAGLEFFRSHPYSQNRWDQLQQLAEEHKWLVSGELTDWKQE
ncbi:hypothetical protein NBRC116583_02750 [Arenicella sp. 4NH20-0111]|uniref:M48 family metallopeptidase n=1 Tax=Arenicella sp. 4NH20-0111 TaxID=3127648 RepID=UPI0031069A74